MSFCGYSNICRPRSAIPVILVLIVIIVFLAKPSDVTFTPALDRYWRVQEYAQLSAENAFNNLSIDRRKYVYHLNKAAWLGSFVSAAQTSPESPSLMIIILNALQRGLNSTMDKAGFSDDEKQNFRRYSCGILVNQGNYRGDTGFKFVPEEIDRSRLKALFEEFCPNTTDVFLENLFALTPSVFRFPPEGETQYWRGLNPKDAESLVRFMQFKHIMIGNQFAVNKSSVGKSLVELRFASQLKSTDSWKWKDFVHGQHWESFANISLSRGAYSGFLTLIARELTSALEYVDNEHMKRTLEYLLESLNEGDLKLHVESGKEWVKAMNQDVDTYMGFTENYRDPLNVQLEYSSFVGLQDPYNSAAFGTLTNRSAALMAKLPWSKEFEPESNNESDSKSFSSLFVTSYVANVLPRGVNLPNYEEVKLRGHKNFNLANVVQGKAKFLVVAFLDKEDSELLQRHYVEAFTIKLGIHELLGHGSGLLLRKDEAGKPNFNESLIDPTTNSKIAHWYKPAATFASVFENIASAYEELRANSIALYLACDREVLAIFGHEGKKADDVCLAVYLNQVFSGFTALSHFDAKAGWLSGHAQSEFVILRALLDKLPNLVQIERIKDQDLRITVNRSMIPEITKEAFEDFVQKVQIYRLTANIQAARELFRGYSTVDNEWKELREIIVSRKAGLMEPAFVQGNILPSDTGGSVSYDWVDYPESCDGLLSSWEDRFNSEELKALQSAVEDYLKYDA